MITEAEQGEQRAYATRRISPKRSPGTGPQELQSEAERIASQENRIEKITGRGSVV